MGLKEVQKRRQVGFIGRNATRSSAGDRWSSRLDKGRDDYIRVLYPRTHYLGGFDIRSGDYRFRVYGGRLTW